MNDQRRLMMTVFGAAALLAISMLVSGCNTMEGMGEDISAVGNSLSDAADDDN